MAVLPIDMALMYFHSVKTPISAREGGGSQQIADNQRERGKGVTVLKQVCFVGEIFTVLEKTFGPEKYINTIHKPTQTVPPVPPQTFYATCNTDYCQYAQIFSRNFYHPFWCLFCRADSKTIFRCASISSSDDRESVTQRLEIDIPISPQFSSLRPRL